MLPPNKVKAQAKKQEKENMQFRSFLKGRADEDELDAQFLQLHEELFANYDCSKCRNCCKLYPATVEEREALKMAEFLGMPYETFAARYLADHEHPVQGEYEFKTVPCEFLGEDAQCRLGDCKPEACSEFPYTNKPYRLSSMLSVLSAAEQCPLVFEMLQRLKRIYHFQGGR